MKKADKVKMGTLIQIEHLVYEVSGLCPTCGRHHSIKVGSQWSQVPIPCPQCSETYWVKVSKSQWKNEYIRPGSP